MDFINLTCDNCNRVFDVSLDYSVQDIFYCPYCGNTIELVNPVQVDDYILEGINYFKNTSVTDPLSMDNVILVSTFIRKAGFTRAANWIINNKNLYLLGLEKGFEVKK